MDAASERMRWGESIFSPSSLSLTPFLLLSLTSKHFRQNVCWQGSTFDVVSNRSRHTEHSSKSLSVCSSIASTTTTDEEGKVCAVFEFLCTAAAAVNVPRLCTRAI